MTLLTFERPPINIEEALMRFLTRVKKERFIPLCDLSGEEIQLAEELVHRKLLSKVTTRVMSFYTYGATIPLDLNGGSQKLN
jgi:hypothetical protein